MMKMLILGASGFVGRNIYEYMGCGYDIDAPTHSELNVLCEKDVYECLKKRNYDVVINALDGDGSDLMYFENRLRMYMNLSRHRDMYGKMIWFGSGAEYGREQPIANVSEEAFGRVIPRDSYGFCLHQMSIDTLGSDNIYNMRLFGIFGKYELWRERFISNAICKGLHGYPISIKQDRVMDYLYIDDLCKMTEWMCINNPVYHIYNATSGIGYYLSELADVVNNHLSSKVPVFVAKDGLAAEYTSSNDRIMREMKNVQLESIDESVSKLMAYYKANISQISKEMLLY